MDIILSNQSGKPIYEQICEQIKSLIISGKLSEGDALPSMRLLAKELRISVITTKRAYEAILVGEMAVKEGLIHEVGGISEALFWLHQEIERRRKRRNYKN